MVPPLDDLGQHAVGAHAGEDEAGGLELVAILGVDFVTVAMAFADLGVAVDGGDFALRIERRLVGAEAHGAAQVAGLAALLQLVALQPFGHQADNWVFGLPELGGACALETSLIARRFNAGHLHAEADAEERRIVLARERHSSDLAFAAALAETARHQDAVHAVQIFVPSVAEFFELLGLDPADVDLDVVGDAAVVQRFDQRFVGVLELGVLADHADRDFAVGRLQTLYDRLPPSEIRLRRDGDAEVLQEFGVEAGQMVGDRRLVDRLQVARFDHRAFADVAEQRDLLLFIFRDRAIAAAEQDVRLNADRAQFFHRMLRRLCLHLAG